MIWAREFGKARQRALHRIQTLANETGGELLADKPENLNTTFSVANIICAAVTIWRLSLLTRNATARRVKLKIDLSPPLQKRREAGREARRSYVAPLR